MIWGREAVSKEVECAVCVKLVAALAPRFLIWILEKKMDYASTENCH